MNFGGSTALVTGGAGGIGMAICRTFAKLGGDLVLADRDGARLDALPDERELLGAEACRREGLHLDVPVGADAHDSGAVGHGADKRDGGGDADPATAARGGLLRLGERGVSHGGGPCG